MSRIPLGIETDHPGNYQTKLNNRERKLAEAVRDDRNIDEAFRSALNFSPFNKDAGSWLDVTAEPAAGQEHTFSTASTMFERHIIAIESTGTAVWSGPSVSADGLELVVDADATDGITAYEVSNGILSTARCAYTVGSFPGSRKIYFEARVKIDDISDLTELWAGFRKAEAYQVDPDNYDEMSAFNIGKDADGQVEIHNILNNAATAETDTTLADWADGETHTLRIEVANTGICTYKFDGAEPTVKPSFRFDAGEVLVPFMALTTAVGDPGVSVATWKCGIV